MRVANILVRKIAEVRPLARHIFHFEALATTFSGRKMYVEPKNVVLRGSSGSNAIQDPLRVEPSNEPQIASGLLESYATTAI